MSHWLAQVGKTQSQMVGAFIVSVPWNSFQSTISLEKPLNWLLFNRHLTQKLLTMLQRWVTFRFWLTEYKLSVESMLYADLSRPSCGVVIFPLILQCHNTEFYWEELGSTWSLATMGNHNCRKKTYVRRLALNHLLGTRSTRLLYNCSRVRLRLVPYHPLFPCVLSLICWYHMVNRDSWYYFLKWGHFHFH